MEKDEAYNFVDLVLNKFKLKMQKYLKNMFGKT